jgi:hypothetical protein
LLLSIGEVLANVKYMIVHIVVLKSERLCLRACTQQKLANPIYLIVQLVIRAAADHCTPCAAGTYSASGEIRIWLLRNQQSISGFRKRINTWGSAFAFALIAVLEGLISLEFL